MRNISSLTIQCLLGVLLSSTVVGSNAFGQAPPSNRASLLKWLQAGTYRQSYTPETAVRESFTAHGSFVRTWYSPALVSELRRGKRVFRRNVAMVKELYGNDPSTVRGWSVMRKVGNVPGRRAANWLFFEQLPNNGGTFFGRGLGLCAGCHRTGTDYLLTPFRP